MIELTNESLEKFNKVYNNLSDSIFKIVNYNILKNSIELIIHISTKDDGIVDSNIRFEFNNIEEFNIKNINTTDYINKCYFKYITYKNKDCICFADDINTPLIYIVATQVSYEEI